MEQFNTLFPEKPLALEQFRLRNPKLEDLGEVIYEGETMESYYLFDEKEIYL